MKLLFSKLDNEEGSAIVVALLILAVLTIMGISSTNNSTIELNIVRNEQIYQTNFYQAEASAYEAAQRIEQETNTNNLIVSESNLDWMNNDTLDYFDQSNWLNDGSANDNTDVSVIDPNAFYSAVGKGVRMGSSLDIGATRLYEYAVFGMSQWNNGNAVVEIGYLRRF